jgi:hypothetical protein
MVEELRRPMITLKLRRAYSWRWELENPVLADGEPGFETNTGRLKIGNGFTLWNDLQYFTPDDEVAADNSTLPEHINSQTPHPVYDDGPSLTLIYENAKV